MQHPPRAQEQYRFKLHEPTIARAGMFIKKGQRSGGGRPGPLLEGRVRIVKFLICCCRTSLTNSSISSRGKLERKSKKFQISFAHTHSALFFLLPLIYMR